MISRLFNNPIPFLILIVAIIGGHIYLVERAVSNKETELRAEFYQQTLESIEDAARTEDRMRLSFKEKIKERDEKIASIDADRKRLNSLLNSRPSRTDSPKDSGNNASCTGTQLYREDGEFLAGEAARAEKLIVERDMYYNQLINIAKELDDLRNASH